LVFAGIVSPVFGLGCSSVSNSTSASDDGVGGQSLQGCLEVTSHPGYPDSFQGYVRKTWDGSQRILTVGALKWRYGTNGRQLSYVVVEPPFQSDSDYDEHDNILESRSSSPSVADVTKPSEDPPSAWTFYANEYDSNGRLAASTTTRSSRPDSDERRVYSEDADGRCVRIETTLSTGTGVELRSYDEKGLLVSIEAAGQEGVGDLFSYDEQGRVISETYSGPTRFGGGTATRTVTHTYRPDGSEMVEVLDGFTDIGIDQHKIVTRTAACLAIDVEIGKPADARCRVVQ